MNRIRARRRYARLRMFIQLPVTLTKLCHNNRDHPVHIMLKMSETLAGWSHLIWYNFVGVMGV